jgi:hypothetical protein
MFRAIGFLILLWGFANFFTASFQKLDEAGVAVLQTVITSASLLEVEMQK